ncbi:MAG TPA: MBL fold metallo-hydrolase [Tepidisphaeraceae bacterium]|nr:MBL fold metallo-hydrolase [Tepidisphaeraceae bacterium]
MRIQFCGADRTVTGSCHVVETNGKRIVLDFGMYQGQRDEARRINSILPENIGRADAIVLSHGHLDHCGRLPVAVREGFAGPIYCTAATAEVARIVLQDAAKIQEEDADYLNRRDRAPGEEPIRPLYSASDVGAVLRQFRRVKYGERVDLGGDVAFTLFDAGHILGSAYVWLETVEGGRPYTLLFTADVGRYDTPIIRDPAPPPGVADTVITESTYGNRAHAPMDEVEPQFLAAVQHCIARRSRLVIPSFAIGRTQTVLWYMQKFIAEKRIPPIPLYVDSPMGVEATHAAEAFRDFYDEETSRLIGQHDLFGLANVTLAKGRDESKRINNDRGPCVIIASSPTCEFGRVLHHVATSVERPDDLILFCGFTPPHTLGRRLQDGQRRVRILNRWYDLKCEVRTIHGLSAHADGGELLRFLKPTLSPRTTAFVVHGEADQAEAFAARLVAGGLGRAVVPAYETSEYAGSVSLTLAPRDPSPSTRGEATAGME